MTKIISYFISIVLIIGGCVFLVFPIWQMVDENEFMKTAVENQAVITDFYTYTSDKKTKCGAVITYTVDGTDYTGEISNIYNYKKNDLVTIYYDPGAPDDFKQKTQNSIINILLPEIFAAVFIFINVLVLYRSIQKDKKKKQQNQDLDELRYTGRRVMAEIKNIEIIDRLSVDKARSYILKCVYTDPITFEMFVFKSGYIGFDVEKVIGEQCITTVPVYIDQNDSSRYLVDIQTIENYK